MAPQAAGMKEYSQQTISQNRKVIKKPGITGMVVKSFPPLASRKRLLRGETYLNSEDWNGVEN